MSQGIEPEEFLPTAAKMVVTPAGQTFVRARLVAATALNADHSTVLTECMFARGPV